jgi:predicted nucleic acid-binding protein
VPAASNLWRLSTVAGTLAPTGRRTATREAIFACVDAALHDPIRRETYAINVRREVPRPPVHDGLRAWAASGERRLALRIGHEAVEPWRFSPLALGSLRDRSGVLALLDGLPSLPVAEPDEVRTLIERRRLFGRGIGFVDAALLAGCLLARGTALWTLDRRLDAVARDAGLSFG